jgi:hypothetical protein
VTQRDRVVGGAQDHCEKSKPGSQGSSGNNASGNLP